ERPALDRSGAVTAECEASRTGGFAVESPAQTSGAIAGDRSPVHKCSRHHRSVPPDAAARFVIPLCRLLFRTGNRAAGLSVPPFGVAQIAVPAISFSRLSPACWRARVRVDVVFASARTRCKAW